MSPDTTILDNMPLNLEPVRTILEDTSMPEMTSCQIWTSFFLGDWCTSREFPTNHPPSFLLVNCGGAPDPCMTMVESVFLPWPPVESDLLPAGVYGPQLRPKGCYFDETEAANAMKRVRPSLCRGVIVKRNRCVR